MKRLSRPGIGGLLVALGIIAAAPVAAQFIPPAPNLNLNPPFDYPTVLSATPVQVRTIDPARRRIIFFNPSSTATIAFCPSQVTRPGVTFNCAVNGAGSITLPLTRSIGSTMMGRTCGGIAAGRHGANRC